MLIDLSERPPAPACIEANCRLIIEKGMQNGVVMALLSELCNGSIHQSTPKPASLSGGSDREQANHGRIWGIARQTAAGSRGKNKPEESLGGDLDDNPALRVVELWSGPLSHASNRCAIT